MPGPLVEQLLDAGLIDEEQARASDLDDPLVSPSRVIQNLVTEGLDERILAGFFVSQGFGPVLHAAELERADRELVRRLPATEAHDLCAMPLRSSPVGIIVAMADPTDSRAVDRLREWLGTSILPTVAKLSDLLDAIDRAYPPDRPTLVTDPWALMGSRAPSGVVSVPRQEIGPSYEASWSALQSPLPDLASTASPVWDSAWNHAPTERDLPPVAGDAPRTRSRSSEVAPPAMDDVLGGALRDLARAQSRDEAVRIACRACSRLARSGAFLALRKGVFRGWEGAGEDITSAGIRSLWVPASNPSMLNDVLHTGKAFIGPYGDTAADHLFRAALGSRGREVAVIPILIGNRMVGVLCADDPARGGPDFDRLGSALASALERLIISRKAGN